MEQLKRLRAEKGLSQARLAARAGLDPSTVNQIERGAREASPATLRKLAEALEVSIAELLEEYAPKARRRSSPEPTLNDALADERRRDNEAALAVLFRGLARRARRVLERARSEGRSPELAEEAAALHSEADALYRLAGPRYNHGTGSEELADAVDAYEEVEGPIQAGTIQAMLRQDVEATDEERGTASRFRGDASDASKRGKADAS